MKEASERGCASDEAMSRPPGWGFSWLQVGTLRWPLTTVQTRELVKRIAAKGFKWGVSDGN
jgi:hypothetical protein